MNLKALISKLSIRLGGRRTGRTSTLVKGVLASPDAIFVVANQEEKRHVLKSFPELKYWRVSTIEELDRRLAGRDFCPIILDHVIVEHIIDLARSRQQILEITQKDLVDSLEALTRHSYRAAWLHRRDSE